MPFTRARSKCQLEPPLSPPAAGESTGAGPVSVVVAQLGPPTTPPLLWLAAVVASEKGVVVGRLSFREDGDLIDCRRMGVGGKAIPPNIDKASKQGHALHACPCPLHTNSPAALQ